MMNLTFLFTLVSIATAFPQPAHILQLGKFQDPSNFEVKSLPDGPQLPKSWAGRLPVPETEEGNSLFFWLFEVEDLTYDDNFIIWLNGGPGCSSLIGLTTGNGPILFKDNATTLTSNPFSWTKFAHVLYVDQPVGTGFSTASNPNPATTNDRVTSDFYGWMTAFYKQFPHLLSKKTHLMGESWAGIYVPYFAWKILENHDDLPINLHSISLGDGTFGNEVAILNVAVNSYIRSKNATLRIPDDILDTFTEADRTCGFDSVLKKSALYPPEGPFHIARDSENYNFKRKRHDANKSVADIFSDECNIYPTTKEEVMKSIVDNCYGPCATYNTAQDYLDARSVLNPGSSCFDIYNIEHDCHTPDLKLLLTNYYNRPDVQTALNIPPADARAGGKTPFVLCNTDIQRALTKPTQLPTPPAYHILPDLLTNKNISTHIYQGENDMLINHHGIELVLQNMTWNGMQGFQKKPNTPFGRSAPAHAHASASGPGEPRGYNSEETVGIWAEERGLTYHLFKGAGHAVPIDKPVEMWYYVRDVVLGSP